MKTVKLNGETLFVRRETYSNGRPALQLLCKDGEPYAMATVNLPDKAQEEGHVFLKGWSENEGIPEALEAAGIVKRTGLKLRTGFAEAEDAVLCL
jgi:hypothetical protein